MGFWALHNITPKPHTSHAKFTRAIMRRIELYGSRLAVRETLIPIIKVMCKKKFEKLGFERCVYSSENKGADCNYREELTPIDKVMCEEHWALVENL